MRPYQDPLGGGMEALQATVKTGLENSGNRTCCQRAKQVCRATMEKPQGASVSNPKGAGKGKVRERKRLLQPRLMQLNRMALARQGRPQLWPLNNNRRQARQLAR
jgi:hypothetical protein